MTDKRIRLTEHAAHMVSERGLLEEWIAEVIRSPAETEPDPAQLGAMRAFGPVPGFGNRVLRVVYYEDASEYRVITAFFDRGWLKRRGMT